MAAGKPLLIIAGNHKQARDWVVEHDLHWQDYTIIDWSEQLRGCSGNRFVVLGTWYMRSDWDRMSAAIAMLEAFGGEQVISP